MTKEQALNSRHPVSFRKTLNIVLPIHHPALSHKLSACTNNATPALYSNMPNQVLEILLLVKEHGEAYDGSVDQQSSNY